MSYPETTIVIPVKNPPDIDSFIVGNKQLFAKCSMIVVDSGGGERLSAYSDIYEKRDCSFWVARRWAYDRVKTKLTLNLDADVILPPKFLQTATALIQEKVAAASIFYIDVGHCQGALEFGASLWRSSVLKKLYDFSFDVALPGKIVKVGEYSYAALNNGWCECTYMWRKLKDAGLKLETVDGLSLNRAVHLHSSQ